LTKIYPLKDGFGLLEECATITHFISLIFLDFRHHTLKKLDTIEYQSNWIRIFVDKADPTTFLLNGHNQRATRVCKIVDNTIVIGDLIEINFNPECFYDKCVYGLKWRDRHGEDLEVRILNVFS
jgi:hypothetical protein